MNAFIPDVYIFTDHNKGVESGESPGFGLSLVAETTAGVLLSAEAAAETGKTDTSESSGTESAASASRKAFILPEDLGAHVSEMLCEEIARRGCVDSTHQALMLTLMACGPEDVSRIRLGKVSSNVSLLCSET